MHLQSLEKREVLKECLDVSLKYNKIIDNDIDKKMLCHLYIQYWEHCMPAKKKNDSVISSYQNALNIVEEIPTGK